MADVSVVIPTVLADLPALSRAVASARTQSLPPTEVIVVVDRPSALAGDLDLPGATIVVNEGAHGAAAARNLGVARASAELVALLDDDDEWLPDKLRVQVDALTRHELDVVACRARVTAPTGTWVMPGEAPGVEAGLADWFFVDRGLFTAQARGIATPTLVARRELLVRLPFDEQLSHWEDVDWLLRAVDQGARFRCLPEILCRVHLDFDPATSQSAGGDADALRRWADLRLRRTSRRAHGGFLLSYVVWQLVQEDRRAEATTLTARVLIRGAGTPRAAVKALSVVALTPGVRARIAGLSRGSFRGMTTSGR